MHESDSGKTQVISQNCNCLMQELDRFDAVVIETTNLLDKNDPALLRLI